MQTSRRGECGDSAPLAWRSSTASKSGSARETPPARRKLRLENFIGLLALENGTLHDLMNQRPQAIIFAANLADDRIDLGLVCRLGGTAGSIGEQLGGQGDRKS